MKLLEDWGAEVSTNCTCSYFDEATGEEVFLDLCDGCGEWQLEDTLALLEEWLKRNDYPDAVIINGVAMGWQRRSGYALVREYGSDKIAREVLNKLMLNGDFTIEFKLTGRACHAVRRSHDELGASFELEAFTPCDGWSECQAIEGITEHEGQNLCAWCLDLYLANN